jgi:hypothetical protein
MLDENPEIEGGIISEVDLLPALRTWWEEKQ